MAESKLNIRVEMQGEMLDRFKKVQAVLGIESGTDVFRYLVSDYYHQRVKASAEDKLRAPGGICTLAGEGGGAAYGVPEIPS